MMIPIEYVTHSQLNELMKNDWFMKGPIALDEKDNVIDPPEGYVGMLVNPLRWVVVKDD